MFFNSKTCFTVYIIQAIYIKIEFCPYRQSNRQVSLHDIGDMDKPLAVEEQGTTPAILVPFYDEDSKTCFVTGRVSENAFNCRIRSFFSYLKLVDVFNFKLRIKKYDEMNITI